MLQSELDGKRVVVALGGNALGETPGEQLKLLENTSKNLAHMVKEGINVVVTHGNGPQVGIIDEAFEVASKDKDAQVPPMPLSDCNAMSQGYIGYDLQNAIREELLNRGIGRPVTTILTQVVVNPYDDSFYKPVKVIGRVMTREEADAEEEKGNYVTKVEGGYRRIVSAPKPWGRSSSSANARKRPFRSAHSTHRSAPNSRSIWRQAPQGQHGSPESPATASWVNARRPSLTAFTSAVRSAQMEEP